MPSMFNNLFSKGRQYSGDVPEPKALTVRISIELDRKLNDYHSESLSTSKLDATLAFDSDARIKDIRSAIEAQVCHVLSPIEDVLESDPRLTDGAWKKSQTKEE